MLALTEGVFTELDIFKNEIINKIKNTLIEASTVFPEEKKNLYRVAISKEDNINSKWVLDSILENAIAAEANKYPLCDDTGIPHVILDIGKNVNFKMDIVKFIKIGIKEGLRALPGRPMGIKGNDLQRLDQSGGLDDDSGNVESAPIYFRVNENPNELKAHILMLGGGPAIRGMTYRVFHRHSIDVIINAIVERAVDSMKMLGCTPAILAVGIGRSQYEATCMMMEAMVDGNYGVQSEIENKITQKINESNIGSLGLHGTVTCLNTFLKVGPQRASGVRIVAIRPCCCFEPRKASVIL